MTMCGWGMTRKKERSPTMEGLFPGGEWFRWVGGGGLEKDGKGGGGGTQNKH